MEMRQVLNAGLKQLMAENENIVLLEADLGKANGTWDIRESYPSRVFEAGIAEQHMVSMAAGMASYGLIPFCGTFTPFATRRACDQIAVSVCYARMNVKIIGTDEGIAAEVNGATHMSFEDISVVRAIPNLLIFSPADNEELRQALPELAAYDGPVYLRMQRKVIPDIHTENYKFDLFKVDTVKDGSDVSIFCMGGILPTEVMKAVDILAAEGIDAAFINVHTLKPLDEAGVLASLEKTGCAVTCDNHNILGGLGSAIAELTAKKAPVPVEMIGVQDRFGEVGYMPYLKKTLHMTAEDIAAAARRAVARKAKK
ncbi:MAG: transketolase family protein [Oscillospiraceae bacterium]|nr:transketolase family protein [Oscillospiraceae bacterium]